MSTSSATKDLDATQAACDRLDATIAGEEERLCSIQAERSSLLDRRHDLEQAGQPLARAAVHDPSERGLLAKHQLELARKNAEIDQLDAMIEAQQRVLGDLQVERELHARALREATLAALHEQADKDVAALQRSIRAMEKDFVAIVRTAGLIAAQGEYAQHLYLTVKVFGVEAGHILRHNPDWYRLLQVDQDGPE